MSDDIFWGILMRNLSWQTHRRIFQMTHGLKNQPDSCDSPGFFNSGFLGKSGLETDDFRWPRLN